ncbi:MAG: hydroxyphenylacetyl-CoA thioesterase PaaI [Gammaproteobacteria bacterium]|uniref:hydroxyphenylacetyl-CoA thioesterase PaaI n=1 Tax=Nevskia sp. TaxID=1929292 RepID=UPI004035E799|nr:hydroxyphenylacetyl-CoA thioesterase PaaI [Gammaproteobacteria bacterium]
MTESTNEDSAALAVARASADAMYARDEASKAMGAVLTDIGPGFATMTMTVRRDMLNGYGTCHGGTLFALADSAFAFACNSRDEAAVAAGCSIEFLRAGREGDRLTATAVERARSGKSGIYDVIVTDAAGEVLALFRGKSLKIGGSVIATKQA